MALCVCLLAGAAVACDLTKDPDEPGNNGGAAITEYTFNVVLEDTAAPVEGVRVQICKGEDFCMMPKSSGADGKLSYPLGENAPGEYEVHIIGGIPEGYSFDNSSVKTSADVAEYTLTLVKNGSQTPGDGVSDCSHNYINDRCIKCGEYKKYEHTVKIVYDEYIQDDERAGQPLSGVGVLITDGISRIAKGQTGEDGSFTFSAPKYSTTDREFNVGYSVVITADDIPEGFYVIDDITFMANATICNVDVYKKTVREPYTAFNPTELPIGSTVQITINERREDDDGGLFGTAHDDSLYYFYIQPSKPGDVGYYRLSLVGLGEGTEVFLGHFPSSRSYVAHNADYDNRILDGEGNVIGYASYVEFMMQKDYMVNSEGEFTYSNSWLFGVRVEGETELPLTFSLKLERLRDIIPGKDHPIEEKKYIEMDKNAVSAAEILEEILEDTSGKVLTDIPVDDIASTELVKDEKGYYHIGSVAGPLVMLKLSVNSRFFSGKDVEGASFTTINSVSGVQNLALAHSEVRDVNGELLQYSVVEYYQKMIEQYAVLCKDGAYVLNQQLYDFITAWTAQRKLDSIPEGVPADKAFLYGCAYYI